MRTQDYENKQRAGAVTPDLLAECQPTHRLFKGGSCPACYLAIPVGPYSSQQMVELFGSSLFIGQRRASDPHPADAANPPTEREVQLRAQLAAMTARYEAAKNARFQAEGVLRRPQESHLNDNGTARFQDAPAGADPETFEKAVNELLHTERECARILHALRREESVRNDRINAWRAKHPEAS